MKLIDILVHPVFGKELVLELSDVLIKLLKPRLDFSQIQIQTPPI